MADDSPDALATELSIMAVRLIRWLRAADDTPALTGQEASAMAVIIYSGGISPSALADLEQVKRPTITQVVNGLIAKGLVKREPHPTDGRGSIIVATELGFETWKTGQARKIAPLADRIRAFSPSERRRLEAAIPLFERLSLPPKD